jgi:hypothetical protein
MPRVPEVTHRHLSCYLVERQGEKSEIPDALENQGVQIPALVEPKDLFAGYDPERARAAIRASAGALRGVDVEKLKRELREQRD